MTLIACVEDDEKIAANIVLRLREQGYEAIRFGRAEDLERWLRQGGGEADMLLVDVRLPGMSGIDLIARLGAERPPTIVISGEASMAETIEAMRLGVHDFLDKPISKERLLKTVQNCLEHAALRRQVAELQAREQRILGRSPETLALLATIEKVAPTDARVLVRGESGSGKELVAAALHRLSKRRRNGPFMKMNCAAIPQHLIEDELFGHARGAFTDAKTAKPGLFEQAHGGTLLLDEIGDMELPLQARLLRVLEDGRVRRIGETADRAVDVRVVAATHRDLQGMVKKGAFREDLYFRLGAVPIDVPPLRARPEDIPLLFTAFFEQFCQRHGRAPITIESDVFQRLREYRWPGNVRELRNVAEQMSVFAADPLTVEQLPPAILAEGDERSETGVLRLLERATIMPLHAFKAQCEKEYIEMVLQRMNWNVSRAAELLDVQRTHLHQKMTTLGIHRPGKTVDSA